MSPPSTSASLSSMSTPSSHNLHETVNNPILSYNPIHTIMSVSSGSPPMKNSSDEKLLTPTQLHTQLETEDDFTIINDFTVVHMNEVTNDDMSASKIQDLLTQTLWMNINKEPSCVEDAFEQNYQKGYTTFNKNRLKQITMSMDDNDNKSNNKGVKSWKVPKGGLMVD